MKTSYFKSVPTKTTRLTYRRLLKYLDAWCRAHRLKIESLSVEKYREFLEEKDWSNSTAYVATCAVRSYLKYCKIDSELAHFSLTRKKPPRQRAVSESDFYRIVSSLDTGTAKGWRDTAILCLMFDTGLRLREAANIRLGDLHIDDRMVDVIAKGDEPVTPVFSELTARVLTAWLAARAEIAGDHDRLWINIRSGEPLTYEGLRILVRRLGERVGLTISPHDLRRGHAYSAHRRGVPQSVGMQQGGWRDQSVYARYTSHLLDPHDFDDYFPSNVLRENGGMDWIKIEVNVEA